MKCVFADTSYWVAILNPKDHLHERAENASKAMKQTEIVTSEMVLTEFLNFFAALGPAFRKSAADFANLIIQDIHIRIVAQTREQFRHALILYNARPDKRWSLTDCASINIAKKEDIIEILTADQHFAQAGLTILLQVDS
jgi:uncharacterized protein